MGDPPIRLEISESDPLEPNMTFWGNFAIFETTAKNSVLGRWVHCTHLQYEKKMKKFDQNQKLPQNREIPLFW